jgi:hypothetical protein
MSNIDYSTNNGYPKATLLLVVAILSVATYSYFTSSKIQNPEIQNAITTFYPEVMEQEETNSQPQGYKEFKIGDYSLKIPSEFNIIEDRGLENSYILDTPMKPYRIRISLINEPFNPEIFKPWVEYQKQYSEFEFTESSINGYKIYQTLQEPYLEGAITTYISLSPTKSLVITGSQNAGDIDPELTNTNSIHYLEYMDIVYSIN